MSILIVVFFNIDFIKKNLGKCTCSCCIFDPVKQEPALCRCNSKKCQKCKKRRAVRRKELEGKGFEFKYFLEKEPSDLAPSR